MARISIRHDPRNKFEAHADRTAVAILEQTGLRPDVVVGDRREYTISLDGKEVIRRGKWGLPSSDRIVRTLMHALGNTGY